jgi:Uma2 family endonuclease
MATQPVFEKPVSVEEYLSTVYEPDCEFVDGAIEERNVGELDHSFLQLFLGSIFMNHRAEWGIVAFSEQRIRIGPNRFRVPDLVVVRSDFQREPILTHPPLIVIEIQSPEDTLRRTTIKAGEYMAFGVEHVWVIDPYARVAYRGTPNGLELVRDGELSVPGTPIHVSAQELFAELDRV